MLWRESWVFGAPVGGCTHNAPPPPQPIRLRITTTFDRGYLDVDVDTGSGSFARVTADGQLWAKGSTVLDKSYPTLSGVRVRGPDNNGWGGTIEYSSDEGGSYMPFVCKDCTVPGSSTETIGVDRDLGFKEYKTRCVGGATCTLLPSPLPLPPPPPPPTAPVVCGSPDPNTCKEKAGLKDRMELHEVRLHHILRPILRA